MYFIGIFFLYCFCICKHSGFSSFIQIFLINTNAFINILIESNDIIISIIKQTKHCNIESNRICAICWSIINWGMQKGRNYDDIIFFFLQVFCRRENEAQNLNGIWALCKEISQQHNLNLLWFKQKWILDYYL